MRSVCLGFGAAALLLGIGLLALGGCAKMSGNIYHENFQPSSDFVEGRGAPGRIKIKKSPMPLFDSDQAVEGYVILGRSEFWAEKDDEEPKYNQGHPLRAFSDRIGADLVYVDDRYSMKREVLKKMPAMGAAGSSLVFLSVPVQVSVDTYDFLVVYYRKSEEQP